MSASHRVAAPMLRGEHPRQPRRWWPDPMAPRPGARDPPVRRRCTDGSSRGLYVCTRRAQRGAVAGRSRAREEAACLEATEAFPGTTAPAQALRPDVGGPRDKRASAGRRFARVAPFPSGRRRDSSRGGRSPAHVAPARRPLQGGAPRSRLAAPARLARGDCGRGRRRRADRRSRPPRRLSRRRRFTTVYKFALLETAAKLRKRAWQGREVPLEPDAWNLFESVGLAPAERVEQSELLSTWRRRSVNC